MKIIKNIHIVVIFVMVALFIQCSGQKDSEINKEIKSEEYQRFIFVKNVSETYVIDMMKEFGSLSGNEEYETANFWIATDKDWKIIKTDKIVSFFMYHNLVTWFEGYDDSTEVPELLIGFARHKVNLEEDYLFFSDVDNEYGDTQLGAFRNGKSFSVYLPESFKKYGNLTIKKDLNISFEKYSNYIFTKEFDITKLDSLKWKVYPVKINL